MFFVMPSGERDREANSFKVGASPRNPRSPGRRFLAFGMTMTMIGGSRGMGGYPNASSLARCAAFTTALIRVTRNFPSSSSMIASIVQPAGVVTASFSSAG
jgi:hypothetical protein